MATRKKILLPRSDIPNRAPTVNEIDFGEIAINTHDGKAFIKRQANGEVTIESIGSEQVDNVYYVSKSGQFGNDGRSLMNSFKTLDSAVAVVLTKQGFKFDKNTCERDLHLIMDAVRYDMVLNTNFNSVTAGNSYRRGNAKKVTGQQKYQTRRAINEERVGMISAPLVASNKTANDRIVAGFTEIIDIFYDGKPDDLYFVDPPIEAQTDANQAAAIIQQNRTAIQDAVITYLNNAYITPYDEVKCYRDVGLILDAVADDLTLGTNYNTITAGWAYKRANSAYVLSDQNDVTVAAINYARNLTTAISGVTSDSTINNLFANVTNVIDGTQTTYPAISYPNTGGTYQTADRIAAATALQTNRAAIIAALTTYIQNNHQEIYFSSDKCERDTGLIIDAVRRDLILGTNHSTITAAQSYLRANGAQYVLADQAASTIDAVEFARDAIKAITGISSYALIDTLFGRVISVLNGGVTTLTAPSYPTTAGSTYQTGDRILAASEIQSNKAAIISGLTSYIQANFPAIFYNAAKCERDLELIINAVRRDLLLGTDYSTLTAANAYLRANSAYVLSDQSEATVAAVVYARNEIKALPNVTSDATIDTLFQRIIDVLEGTVTVYTVPSYPVTAGSTYQTTDRVTVAQSLRNNRALIVTELIDWVNANYAGLVYDQTKCERDIAYILDALAHDIQYGGNTGTLINAESYFVGTTNQLGSSGEITASIAAYNQLKIYLNTSSVESPTQYVTTLAEQNRVGDLLDEIINVLTAGTTTVLSAEVEPNPAGLTTTEHDEILNNTASVVVDTSTYVSTTFPNYDEAKCERDTGFILDALTHDIKYGGNTANRVVAQAYFEGTVNQLDVDNSRPAEIAASIASYEQLKSIVNTYVLTAPEQTRVNSLLDITIDVLTAGNIDGLVAVEEIDTTGLNTAEFDLIALNQEDAVAQTVTYVITKYPTYDEAKCERDTGYIIDALTHDVKYGGNVGSRTNSQAYFVGTVSQLGYDSQEVAATISAYEQLKVITDTYVTTSAEQTRIDQLLDVIIDPIEAGNLDALAAKVDIDTGGLATGERNLILGQRTAIQEGTIDYVNDTWAIKTTNIRSYDAGKCSRDVGLIIDAVTKDLVLGTNYNTVTAGWSYNRLASAYVLSDQKSATLGAIVRARDLIKQLPYVTSDATIDTLFANVTNVIDGTQTTYPTISYPNTVDSTYQTADRINAATAIQSNRATLIGDLTTYIQTNFPDIYFDPVKCERDVGLIIDAVRRDLILETDYNTYTAAAAYLRANSAYVLSDQNTATVAGVNYARDQIKALPNVTSDATIDTLFARITDVISGAVTTYTQPSYPTTLNSTYQTQDRSDATDEIQANRATIIGDLTAWITANYPALVYDTAKCERDTGYVLDALSHDIKYGGNTGTRTNALSYFVGAVSQLGAGEEVATAAAYGQLKTLVNSYVVSAPEQTRVNDLLDEIIGVINAGSTSGLAVEVDIDTGGLTTTEYDDIASNTAAIQTATSTYVEENFPQYNVAACERDTGYILDALSHDIQYGGNSATVLNARSYYVGTIGQLGSTGEYPATSAAYDYLKTLINTYVLTQAERFRVEVLLNVIIEVIDDRSLDNLDAELIPDFAGLSLVEYNAIQDQKDDVQDAIIAYVDETFKPEYPDYDEQKCYRDVGLILDAVRRDLIIGTDYNTITAGNAYLRANSEYVLSDQKDKTIQGVEFARDQVKALANVTSDATIDTLFTRVTDVLRGYVTSYITPSYPTTVGSTFQSGNRITIVDAMQAGRSIIVENTISYIDNIDPNLEYDTSKCRRDVGYIVDALCHDVKYGGNSASRQNAASYFVGATSQLGAGETATTILAYTYLNTILAPYINGDVTVANEVQSLLTIITDVITAGNLDTLASEVEIDTSGLDTTEFNAIDLATLTIQDDTISFINDLFFNPAYDVNKCARDIGKICDAVALEYLTRSTFPTEFVALTYRRPNAQEVYLKQRAATIAAVRFAEDLIKGYITTAGGDATRTDAMFQRIIDGINAGSYTVGVNRSLTNPVTSNYNGTQGGVDNTGSTADTVLAQTTLNSNNSAIVSQVLSYVNDTLGVTSFDNTICGEDLAIILQSLAFDVDTGTNWAAREVAESYLVGVVNQLGNVEAEITATIAAYEYLKTYLNANLGTLSGGLFVSQEASILAYLSAQIDIIIDVIKKERLTDMPALVYPSTVGEAAVDILGFNAILENTTTVQNRVIDFVNDSNPVDTFDDEKCSRDVGLIAKAVLLDLENNTNYNSLTAGLSYQRVLAQKVQTDQLEYTVRSINYLRDLMLAEFSSSNQAFITARFKEIVELLEQKSDYGLTDGDPIDYSGSVNSTIDQRNAANALIANRRQIQKELTTWIQVNYDTFEYDPDKCERDVGYLIDGLVHDILFGGQYAAETAARSYWVGTDLNIEGNNDQTQNLDGVADFYELQLGQQEKDVTALAYGQLKNLIAQRVLSTAERTRVNDLLDIVIDSITSPRAVGPTLIPDTTITLSGEAGAAVTLIPDWQTDTLAFANKIFPSFTYDQTKCRRDVGFIVDALTYDLKYGGNSASSIAMRSYFSIFNDGYGDLLGQNEYTMTLAAYRNLRNSILPSYLGILSSGIRTRTNGLLDMILFALKQTNEGTFQLGEFFGANRSLDLYQYNYPAGLPTGYNELIFPDLIALGYKIVYNDLYNVHQAFNIGESQRLTIIRSSNAVANNQGTDSTIFLKSGDYVINNPIKLPPKTAIIGDALRSTTIRPKNVDSDIFWADNGVYIKEITFRDHQGGAAALAFDPRVDSPGAGPFITQSPYVQNCTSLTSSGIGLRIDGSKVSGLRSMVLDAFTQFNAGGIGVHLLNRGYAQLVSLFTVSTTTSVLATSGGQCSLTNSNSSFGERGLVSTGGSKSLYNGSLHANYIQNDNLIRINSVITRDSADYTLNLGDYKKPNYNDAIRFDSDNYYYTVLDVSEEITQDWATTGNTTENEQGILALSSAFPQVDKTTNGRFGHSVHMSQNDVWLAASEPFDGAGKVEIYQKDFVGGVPQWDYHGSVVPTATLPAVADVYSEFGKQVQLTQDGTYLAVSAPGQAQVDATVSANRNGAVYTYRRTGDVWMQDAEITIPGVTDRDREFGCSMDLTEDGLTMAIATKNDLTAGGQGAVYIYLRTAPESSLWTQQQRLTCPDGNIIQVNQPVVQLNQDGTDLLIHWRGSVNKIYYYQRNIDNIFILAQQVIPRANLGLSREGDIRMNADTTHFVFGDPAAPRGYITNEYTDSDQSAPFEVARKQKVNNLVFTNGPATITTSDTDRWTDFSRDFPAGATVTVKGSNSNDGDYVVSSATQNTLTVQGAWPSTGADQNVQIYITETGVAEFFAFEEGQWVTEDIIEAPLDVRNGFGFGSGVDINQRGLLASIGNRSTDKQQRSQVTLCERARSDWRRVADLEPVTTTTIGIQGSNDAYGSYEGSRASAVGGSGDFVVIGAAQRRETLNDANTEYGALFSYYSILEETGSYELLVAPALNRNLKARQNASFHQRSLITASGHTFEYVGSGTNMFTAIPQNGGVPKKENEVIFDSAEAEFPNFGLVYFTATDELGDFRIGEDLTINREEGTITGVTFDRSLFAVLTPFILALEG